MTKHSITISLALAVTLMFSVSAFATESWLYSFEELNYDKAHDWGNLPTSSVASSKEYISDGQGSKADFWTRLAPGMMQSNINVNGFSVNNHIGEWMDNVGNDSLDIGIRFSVRNDWNMGTLKSDVLRFNDDYTEYIEKHGTDAFDPPVTDHLGITEPYAGKNANLISLEMDCAPDGKYKYFTLGREGMFDNDGNLTYALHPSPTKRWGNWSNYFDGGGSGYGQRIHWFSDWRWQNGDNGETFGDAFYSNNEWYVPVTISSTTYNQKFTDAYDGDNYPTTSGTPFVWYDDYYLYNTLGYNPDWNVSAYTEPTTLGEQGRYVLVRDELYTAGAKSSSRMPKPHAGDVAVDMNTTGPDDYENQGYFEYAWKIAGTMVGQKFWEDDPDYYWSSALGRVVEATDTDDAWMTRIFYEQFLPPAPFGGLHLPDYVWNAGTSTWDLPAVGTAKSAYENIWGFPAGPVETPVGGYDTLEYFMQWVFDIDALVIEDANNNGVFDVGSDYIMFSVLDDGTWGDVVNWTNIIADGTDVTNFDGEYFDGNTVFLYDGNTVQTWFDPGSSMFFGQYVSTIPATLLAGMMGDYDLDALDITIPEPSTIILIIGSCLAVGAGILRKKMR